MYADATTLATKPEGLVARVASVAGNRGGTAEGTGRMMTALLRQHESLRRRRGPRHRHELEVRERPQVGPALWELKHSGAHRDALDEPYLGRHKPPFRVVDPVIKWSERVADDEVGGPGLQYDRGDRLIAEVLPSIWVAQCKRAIGRRG